jgi:predicted transcriptional regulator
MTKSRAPLDVIRDVYHLIETGEIENQIKKVVLLPPVKTLSALRSPDKDNDPNELIEHRFLYRGGICLLVGPTGIGKSSLLMQLAIYFAIGKPLFGIKPGKVYQKKGMRILLIQAENDEGDLAEMRDGVTAGCDLNEEEVKLAHSRIQVCTVNDQSKDRFAATLSELLDQNKDLDLVMIDPAFAYLGGDSNSQKDVSHFMRNLLNPLLQEHNVGLMLAHHTNKPLRGKEKDNWEAGDYAYLGAGSAEWINPARAALALRSIGSDSVFELRAPKRGKRLRWEDENEVSTVSQFISHHREPGVICWRVAEASEVAELAPESTKPRSAKINMVDLLRFIQEDENQSQSHYARLLSEEFECSENTVQNTINNAVELGCLRYVEKGRKKLYRLTKKGQKMASETPKVEDIQNA